MSSLTSSPTGSRDGFRRLLRARWARFRSGRGRTLAMAASVLVTVSLGLLIAGGVRSTCVTSAGEGPCPAPLVGPDGTAVSDKYYFVHQPLKGDGSITARVSDLTGQMRQPDLVPGVRNVKHGAVPWAKAGLLVRRSLQQGTSYAAVMITRGHGVRMQHDFIHDVAGSAARGPRWLRLDRSGDLLTGYESGDGRAWTRVGEARLAGLPETVEIGLFATSPGALWTMASAFAQATATFDRITLRGANGSWRHDDVGVTFDPDGRTPHHPGGAVESGGKVVVTGGGDIGPATVEGGLRADLLLSGGGLGLILVLVAAVMFHPAERGRRPAGASSSVPMPSWSFAGRTSAGSSQGRPAARSSPRAGSFAGRVLAAEAVVVGMVAFAAGLVAAGIVVPVGLALLRAHRNPIQPITLGTELRVIVGYAALAAVSALLAFGLAALVTRRILAAGLAIALIVVPYLLASAGLAPWLLAITPAAGFAITQSVPAFAHVDVGPSLLEGHYPLPPWAGLTVACGYAVVVLGAAIIVHRRRAAPA
ncbi:hypothetical protein [Nonomuraea fuscirosea]|uniref:hypothetical protein n=1 Tax=Nonomuraea fuscirosea TaxID=1291556 RepID=UPI003442EA33